MVNIIINKSMIWKWGTARIWTRDLPFIRQALLPLSHSTTSVRRQWMEIILTNKPGKHNYKQKYDLKMRRLPGFEPGISCLLDRRFDREATARRKVVDNGWKPFWQRNMVNIIINKSMIWKWGNAQIWTRDLPFAGLAHLPLSHSTT